MSLRIPQQAPNKIRPPVSNPQEKPIPETGSPVDSVDPQAAEQYNDTIVRRPEWSVSLKYPLTLHFPSFIEPAESTEEQIQAMEPKAYEKLLKLKSDCTPDEYQTYLRFLTEMFFLLKDREIRVSETEVFQVTDNGLIGEVIKDLQTFHSQQFKSLFAVPEGNERTARLQTLLDAQKRILEIKINQDRLLKRDDLTEFLVGTWLWTSQSSPLFQTDFGTSTCCERLIELYRRGVHPNSEDYGVIELCLQMAKNPPLSPAAIKPRLERILQILDDLERIKPGVSESLIAALRTTQPQAFDEMEESFGLLQRLAEGLAIQGETDLSGAFLLFRFYGLKPTAKMVENLLFLHRYTGFLHASRIPYTGETEGNQQARTEAFLEDLVLSIQDPHHKQGSKVAFAVLKGASDEMMSDALTFQLGKALESLQQHGYRLYLFEAHTDADIALAAQRVFALRGEAIDLLLLSGHGSIREEAEKKQQVDGKAINLGKPFWPQAFNIVDPVALHEPERLSRWLSPTTLDPAINLPSWQIRNVATADLTEDQVAFDVNDTDLMQETAQYLAPDAVTLFYSCGSANSDFGLSLAEQFHLQTGRTIYAAKDSIASMELDYDAQNRISDVRYYQSQERRNQPPKPVEKAKFSKD